MTKTIHIEPVTRVEGHGKVSIHLNDKNEVEDARLHIVEFRGFERHVQGRPYWEMPVLVQRLCGICPVSHHLAAAKALDVSVGADQLTPTAEKMRRLMHYGQTFQSHISGKHEITEGMLNAVEVAIRAYDPCLSCATHAMERMPLVVEMFDAEGKRIASRAR